MLAASYMRSLSFNSSNTLCLSITFFAITAMMPATSVSATEDISVSKGFFKEVDQTKKLMKYVKKLESFDENTSFSELSKLFRSFKSYAEKESGRKISFKELYKEFYNKIIEYNIPLNPEDLKPMLSNLFKNRISKSLNDSYKDVKIPAAVVLGGVILFCCPLVAVIGFACPLVAPVCYTVASTMAGTAIGLLAQGLLETPIGKNLVGISFRNRFKYLPTERMLSYRPC